MRRLIPLFIAASALSLAACQRPAQETTTPTDEMAATDATDASGASSATDSGVNTSARTGMSGPASAADETMQPSTGATPMTEGTVAPLA